MTAPELPALTMAEASPALTSSKATRMELSRLRRMAWPGCSSISTTSAAWWMRMGRLGLARWRRSSSRTRPSGPTRITAWPARAAATAPCTAAAGAWSPPMASTAIGAMPWDCGPKVRRPR